KAGLDRIGAVIFGDTEEHEILGVFPVRIAKLPECSTKGVEACCGHVDRTEASVGSKVGCAELLGKPAGQGLRLVAAGKESKLPGIGLANIAEPLGCQLKGFIPADFLEFPRSPRADAQHWRLKARRRIVLHDTG